MADGRPISGAEIHRIAERGKKQLSESSISNWTKYPGFVPKRPQAEAVAFVINYLRRVHGFEEEPAVTADAVIHRAEMSTVDGRIKVIERLLAKQPPEVVDAVIDFVRFRIEEDGKGRR